MERNVYSRRSSQHKTESAAMKSAKKNVKHKYAVKTIAQMRRSYG